MTDPVQTQPAQMQPEFEVHPPEFAPQPEAAVVPAPVQPKPKKTGLVVLAVLVVLALGAAGTFGSLYVSEKNRAADLSKQVEEKQKSLTAQTILAQSNLEETQKAQESAKKARDDASAAAACREVAREVTAAALAQDEQKITSALVNMMSKC